MTLREYRLKDKLLNRLNRVGKKKYFREIQKIELIICQTQRERGENSEERFYYAMRDLRNMPNWIVGIRDSSTEEDLRGADFWIMTTIEIEIPVQIKSSFSLLRTNRMKFLNSRIPIIVVQPNFTDDEIREMTLTLCYKYIRKLKCLASLRAAS